MRTLLLWLAAGISIGTARARPGQPPQSPVGVEMRLAPVRSDGGALALALRRFEEFSTGIDEETTRRLRECGLRALAVPIDALPDALGALAPAGAVQQEWLGTLTFWTPIVSGPALDDPHTRLDSGEVNLGAGHFRLLARCWVVPDPTDALERGYVGARLRIELVPQHVGTRSRRLGRLLEPRLESPVSEGLVLERLRLVCDLAADRALVLVPADPDRAWADAPDPGRIGRGSDPPAPRGLGPDPAPDEPVSPAPTGRGVAPDTLTSTPPRRPPGPSAPGSTSLGEQMLRQPGGVEAEGTAGESVRVFSERSVVVVLIAHPPAQYKLIP